MSTNFELHNILAKTNTFIQTKFKPQSTFNPVLVFCNQQHTLYYQLSNQTVRVYPSPLFNKVS